MLLSLAILLATSTAAPGPDVSRGTLPAYGGAWKLPLVPETLPAAKSAPHDGHWTGSDGADGGPGVWLPLELSRDVQMRLELLDRAPGLCAERLRWASERCAVDVRSAVDVALTDAGAQRVREETKTQGWSTWQVALLSVGALALGASVGGAAVLLAR